MAKDQGDFVGSISDFQRALEARGARRTVDTLRLWDRLGIVRADRTELNQRVYRAEHIERALRIIEDRMRGRRS